MNEEKYKKSDIAITQLKAAIKLFNEGESISALTLAGASYEIFASMCRQNAFNVAICMPAEMRAQTEVGKLIEARLIFQPLNKTKNELKHHDQPEDYSVEADFYFEAHMFILGAIENYKTLFNRLPEGDLFATFIQDFGGDEK